MRKTWDRERSADLHRVEALVDDDVEHIRDDARLAASVRHERADHALRPAMDPRRSQRSAVEVTDIAPTWRRCSQFLRRRASEGKPLPLRSPAR